MTLATPKYIAHIYDKNKDVFQFTLQEICFYTDVQYRQVEIWIRDGLVQTSGITTRGSGHNRTFSYDTSFQIALLAQLAELGFGNQKIRDAAKILEPIAEHPFGHVLIDPLNIQNTKFDRSGLSDIDEIIRHHFRYGTAKPLILIELDGIHIDLEGWHYDADLRRQAKLETEIFGIKAGFPSSRLVEKIGDKNEYLEKKKKPVNSRFPRDTKPKSTPAPETPAKTVDTPNPHQPIRRNTNQYGLDVTDTKPINLSGK